MTVTTALVDLVPDADRLSRVFTEAAAPAFFLGAVAGLISILLSRSAQVMKRIKKESNPAELAYLLKRAEYLQSSVRLALAGGICTTLLLGVSFLGAFLQLPHIYGAAILFLLATTFVGLSLFRFLQEAHLSLRELERFRHD